jgi:hypothetical protein
MRSIDSKIRKGTIIPVLTKILGQEQIVYWTRTKKGKYSLINPITGALYGKIISKEHFKKITNEKR